MSAFLREVARVPPITHEQEVEAARMIEQGEREILEAVLHTPLGQQELVALGRGLRSGEIELRDLIRDCNDQRLDPEARQAELLELFGRLAQRAEEARALEQQLRVGDLSAAGARAVESRLTRLRGEIRASLRDAHLAWEPVRAIAHRIRGLARRAEQDGAEGARLGVHGHAQTGLPLEELRAVSDLITRGERRANRGRATLVESYLWLVRLMARRHHGRGMPYLDLVQEGAIGLLRAAEKFDHRLGYRFPTYATWWIRSSMTRGASDQSRTIRLPNSAAVTLRSIMATREELRREQDRDPTNEELAEALDVSLDQIRALLAVSGRTTSLQQPFGGPDGDDVQDFLADDRMGAPSDGLAAKELTSTLHRALQTLSTREQAVLRQRFGIQGEQEHTLASIGETLGVSRERIRQLESRALKKLRRLGAIQELQAYLEE